MATFMWLQNVGLLRQIRLSLPRNLRLCLKKINSTSDKSISTTCCRCGLSSTVASSNCKGRLRTNNRYLYSRCFSTNSNVFPKETCSPEKLTQDELASLHGNICKELITERRSLQEVAQYYFDGKGKAFRPMLVLLTAGACNSHTHGANRQLLDTQRQIAMIAEMIHTASLMHDDVIDNADTRRNKTAINEKWGQKKSILAGDFVLSVSSKVLARIGNEEVVLILSQVIDDLVRGEFMQLGSKEDENERFSHYLKKTFMKTASLMAHSCQAVAVLGKCSDEVCQIAFEYGRNVGMAFQLIDDVLDFVSSDSEMGKPTSADLKLGLATGPVLFAAEKFPELDALIMRRFSEPGDVERAREAVAKTDGIEQTRYIANKYSQEAKRQISQLTPSPASQALTELSQRVITRLK
ncbi:all trans-polyprenyl-diphosphate synthase PDSS1-like [Patiria miniata]|uniref:All trans-polyprenyl-diphosphate synthase PDSS1 n=1 Tax=Patiria miniata TaxID=46514 RepID=A0A913Z4E5_PATMI|nr:all trans-polyprenyl-diphosphate synthase PDSS1-like [Patiria miniata]